MTSPQKPAQITSAKAVTPGRRAWVTPEFRSIEAGSAENGFTQNNKDGQFTSS